MEFNAVTAGVAPGGLVNSSEIRILICYILKTVDEPVPATELCNLLLYEGIANNFEVSDSIANLLKSGHIICVDESKQNYTVTATGEQIAKNLKTSVPITVREKACLATLKMMAQIRNANETDFKIEREGDNTYIVCSALDTNGEIFSVKLLVTDESQATAIKNKFLQNPAEIYGKIIELFTE